MSRRLAQNVHKLTMDQYLPSWSFACLFWIMCPLLLLRQDQLVSATLPIRTASQRRLSGPSVGCRRMGATHSGSYNAPYRRYTGRQPSRLDAPYWDNNSYLWSHFCRTFCTFRGQSSHGSDLEHDTYFSEQVSQSFVLSLWRGTNSELGTKSY